MGKNRRSKKLKSERNKVHIKSKTKFLPKGQNVTNTTFKIKPIVLQEQLKERTTCATSLEKVPELVKKLKHSNDTVKTEACLSLKNAINSVESLQGIDNVYQIIQNASSLVQDRERKVRKASVKLLQALFKNTSVDRLRTHFHYVLINLKCAMTTINKYVKEDSILLLDAILENKTALLAENFDEFFPSFLVLISKLKNNSTSERTLSLNLEGKVTSTKWRIKVLARLYVIILEIVQKLRIENAPVDIKTITIYAEDSIYWPLPLREFSKWESMDWKDYLNPKVTDEDIENNILSLCQLLFDIWKEILPNTKRKSTQNVIFTDEESAGVFMCVVHLLKLLEEYVRYSKLEKLLSQTKPEAFLDSLISNLPYSHNRKKFKNEDFPKSLNFNNDQNCVEENLLIIYIFIKLRTKSDKKFATPKNVGSYLADVLQARFNKRSFEIYIQILKEILVNQPAKQPTLCQKLGVNERQLLQHIANFHDSDDTPDKFKIPILCEILAYSRITKETYMVQLPDLLCQKIISAKIIKLIFDQCRMAQQTVVLGIKKQLDKILNHLVNLDIVITDTDDIKEYEDLIGYALAHCRRQNPEIAEELDRFQSANPDCRLYKFLKYR